MLGAPVPLAHPNSNLAPCTSHRQSTTRQTSVASMCCLPYNGLAVTYGQSQDHSFDVQPSHKYLARAGHYCCFNSAATTSAMLGTESTLVPSALEGDLAFGPCTLTAEAAAEAKILEVLGKQNHQTAIAAALSMLALSLSLRL